MGKRIIDVLAPYEDEVLVSWIVRMLRMYKSNWINEYTGDVMKDLFGPNTTRCPGLYLQKGLQYFCDNCEIKDSTVFGSEEMMYEKLSVIPFYLYFCSDKYKARLKKGAFNVSYYIHEESKLGIRSGHKYIEGKAYYKFCPECLKHQKDYYLKREHQVQGNLVCWEHGCVLHRVPYRLMWKDIDFISKIESDKDISKYNLLDTEIYTAQKISFLIHEIFENGFLDKIDILQMKISHKLIDDAIIMEDGIFCDWNAFYKTLNISYLFDETSFKKEVFAMIDKKFQAHVNPIVSLILIYRLFGSLENYYSYNINLSEKLFPKDAKEFTEDISNSRHDIEYYARTTNKAFFYEYCILGDTENSIVIKHFICGNVYSVSKKAHKLRKCRQCKQREYKMFDKGKWKEERVRYCRYVNTEEFAKLHGKEMKQIRNYCNQNRIPGAIRVGVNILIPIDAPYPEDLRYKKKLK